MVMDPQLGSGKSTSGVADDFVNAAGLHEVGVAVVTPCSKGGTAAHDGEQQNSAMVAPQTLPLSPPMSNSSLESGFESDEVNEEREQKGVSVMPPTPVEASEIVLVGEELDPEDEGGLSGEQEEELAAFMLKMLSPKASFCSTTEKDKDTCCPGCGEVTLRSRKEARRRKLMRKWDDPSSSASEDDEDTEDEVASAAARKREISRLKYYLAAMDADREELLDQLGVAERQKDYAEDTLNDAEARAEEARRQKEAALAEKREVIKENTELRLQLATVSLEARQQFGEGGIDLSAKRFEDVETTLNMLIQVKTELAQHHAESDQMKDQLGKQRKDLYEKALALRDLTQKYNLQKKEIAALKLVSQPASSCSPWGTSIFNKRESTTFDEIGASPLSPMRPVPELPSSPEPTSESALSPVLGSSSSSLESDIMVAESGRVKAGEEDGTGGGILTPRAATSAAAAATSWMKSVNKRLRRAGSGIKQGTSSGEGGSMGGGQEEGYDGGGDEAATVTSSSSTSNNSRNHGLRNVSSFSDHISSSLEFDDGGAGGADLPSSSGGGALADPSSAAPLHRQEDEEFITSVRV